MAHYDIFREQLAIKYPAYGHALWEPSPGRLYSPVEVGDVGYVREGKFHRLFNALLPADHPSHRTFGVPEHHVPLVPNPSEHIDVGTLKPSHLCSHGIGVTTGESDVHAKPDDLPQVSYLCTKRQRGAVSFLPVPAQRQDTIARGDFGQWIIKHIGIWFSFARRLGLGIEQMEDIILVTGFHRTKSWANVAFLESHMDAQVSFGVEVTDADSPGINIKWRHSPERVRGALLSWGPDGKNLSEDQCVFIRGFRVTRTLRILPKHLIAAAGPSSNPDEYDDEPDLELTAIPTITKYQDPLHLLLGHIAENAPDCDMVLVHDDDLERIAGIYDRNETRRIDEVINLLQQSQPEIQRVKCDPLDASESSLKTRKEVTTVALFSWEFQEWVKPHISRKAHNDPQNPVSPSVQPPTLQLPPSHPPSKHAEPASPRAPLKERRASSQYVQSPPNAPKQRLGQTHDSDDPHSRVTDPLDDESTKLQVSSVSGSEAGSGITIRQGIVGAIFGAAASAAAHLLATSSAGLIAPSPAAGPITPSSSAGPFTPSSSAGPITPSSSAGPIASSPSVGHIASSAFTASHQNDVLSWTSKDPRQSQLFSPWGVLYHFQTDTSPQGHSTTTLWRAIRANKEDRVARLEWAPGGGLGRAVIGKNKVPMVDLVRQDPRIPNSRVFIGPDGFQYRWRPSTTNQDIVLQDPNNNVIAFIRSVRPIRYQGLGEVYTELHFLRSAGAGVVMHPPLMDTVTVTAMLYRFVTAHGL